MQIFDLIKRGLWPRDEDFNRIFPTGLEETIAFHFTPLEVARRAASFLAPEIGTPVLDIGSGAGKFCFIGSLDTKGILVQANKILFGSVPKNMFLSINLLRWDYEQNKIVTVPAEQSRPFEDVKLLIGGGGLHLRLQRATVVQRPEQAGSQLVNRITRISQTTDTGGN